MKLSQLVAERTVLCKELDKHEGQMTKERRKELFDKIRELDDKINQALAKICIEEEEV